jgi:hypothetical protein
MTSRQNEADQRPALTPWGSTTIAPSDSAVLAPACRALYVGGAGDVTLRMMDGSTPQFKAVPAGTMLNIQFDQVKATGTTASLMVGLYG